MNPLLKNIEFTRQFHAGRYKEARDLLRQIGYHGFSV